VAAHHEGTRRAREARSPTGCGADKAKADLAHAEKKVVDELRKARESAAELRSGARSRWPS
jgi:hypothetical protein